MCEILYYFLLVTYVAIATTILLCLSVDVSIDWVLLVRRLHIISSYISIAAL